MLTRSSRNTLIVLAALILGAFVLPLSLQAQASRSYYYDSVDADILVGKDASIVVEENLTYVFSGAYHKGFRSIPLNKIGDIDEIEVRDGTTGVPYIESAKALDKEDPNSWGKFYHTRRNGTEEVEWYYSAKDESRVWTLHYKAHGAVTFLKDKDELYWNVFTDLDAPVRTATALVRIPAQFTSDLLSASVYVYPPAQATYSIEAPDRAHFSGSNFYAKTPFTIAFGWPRGVVSKQDYWLDVIATHIVALLGTIMIFLTILTMIVYWYMTEKCNTGRGTIIAQYEPPQQLRPAMADVITKERVSSKAWAATIIDLAVRGFVSIKEDEPRTKDYVVSIISGIVFAGFLFFFFTLIGITEHNGAFLVIPVLALIVTIVRVLFRSAGRARELFIPKHYTIDTLREWKDATDLEDYEKEYLRALFGAHTRFSTREMREDPKRARELYMEMRLVEKKLIEEVESDTAAYDVKLSREGYGIGFIILVVSITIALTVFLPGVRENAPAQLFFILLSCSATIYLFMRFEARLSKQGQILKEEWLGFKLYLETAEKYRLQNLTPELFEKFLPYAIIFGVEKKWGKAFDSIGVPPPSWYSGAHVISSGNISSTVSSGFSASAFSSSFASSFTSSFASSGGGGAS
jgi:uncharacterized membrane protein YgcG